MRIGQPPPPLGLGHFTALGLPPGELVELAGATGFGFVGIRLHPVAPGGIAYPLPLGSPALADLRSRLADLDIFVHDIESVVIAPGFEPASLGPLFDTAHALGASRLNVCADYDDYADLVDQFGQICDLAAPAGLGVDLECMAWRGIDSVAKCRALIEASGRDNAAILVDALHLARCGGRPDDIAALPAKLVHSAQLCDAPRAAPPDTEAIIAEARGRRLAPGDGELPLDDLLSALPEGTMLSLEVPMTDAGPPDSVARRLFTATQSLFARH